MRMEKNYLVSECFYQDTDEGVCVIKEVKEMEERKVVCDGVESVVLE